MVCLHKTSCDCCEWGYHWGSRVMNMISIQNYTLDDLAGIRGADKVVNKAMHVLALSDRLRSREQPV